MRLCASIYLNYWAKDTTSSKVRLSSWTYIFLTEVSSTPNTSVSKELNLPLMTCYLFMSINFLYRLANLLYQFLKNVHFFSCITRFLIQSTEKLFKIYVTYINEFSRMCYFFKRAYNSGEIDVKICWYFSSFSSCISQCKANLSKQLSMLPRPASNMLNVLLLSRPLYSISKLYYSDLKKYLTYSKVNPTGLSTL